MYLPLADNEPARLHLLRQYQILDTPPEAAFDDLARLAAFSGGTSIVLEDHCRGDGNLGTACVLSAHQCDAIQGYLFSHPVSAETLTAILEQGYCFGTEAWNNV